MVNELSARELSLHPDPRSPGYAGKFRCFGEKSLKTVCFDAFIFKTTS
jgi:hypothetical protein